MSNQNSWNQSKTILLIKNFDTLDELTQFRKEIVNSGKNIHECVIMGVVETKKELDTLTRHDSFAFVSEEQFNFFGKLRNEAATTIFKRKFDMVLIIGDLSKRISRRTGKVNRKLSVGMNCEKTDRDINLSTNETSPAHLINFVKQTLEKIE